MERMDLYAGARRVCIGSASVLHMRVTYPFPYIPLFYFFFGCVCAAGDTAPSICILLSSATSAICAWDHQVIKAVY